MNYDATEQFVINNLLSQLNPELTYHDISHTLESVLPAAVSLASLSGIDEEEVVFLKTGALFHDVGYLVRYQFNEQFAAQQAAEFLPSFGYNDKQVALIKSMIMATQMPQSPETFLEQILCDADLNSLGQHSFLEDSLKLRHELSASCAQAFTDQQWLQSQIDFLEKHSYFTVSAKEQYASLKAENLVMLKSALAGLP